MVGGVNAEYSHWIHEVLRAFPPLIIAQNLKRRPTMGALSHLWIWTKEGYLTFPLGLGLSAMKTEAMRLNCWWAILSASVTAIPATIAFVVAIAGIMLPAIAERKSRYFVSLSSVVFKNHHSTGWLADCLHLMSKSVLVSMWKMEARILAQAPTNRIATSSSLSQTRISPSGRRALRSRNSSIHSDATRTHRATDHTWKKRVDENFHLDLKFFFSMFRKKKKLEFFFNHHKRISALMKADEKNRGIACRRLVSPSLCPTVL